MGREKNVAAAAPRKCVDSASFARMAPATCGELVQGTLDGEDFLVTSPIDLFSVASAERVIDPGVHLADSDDYEKVEKALELWSLERRMPIPGIEVKVHTRIARGKGLASSSSEITAALAAAAAAAGQPLAVPALARLATAVEPTDAIYAPGIVRCDPLTGRIYERFGSPPALRLFIVDTGGAVDSAGFDRERARDNSRRHEAKLREALRRVRVGLRLGSAPLVASGTTLSAEIHDHMLPKPGLRELSDLKHAGSLGVCAAHTGTVLGVLFEPGKAREDSLRRRIANVAGANAIVGVHNLVGGGLRRLQRAQDSLEAFASTESDGRRYFGVEAPSGL